MYLGYQLAHCASWAAHIDRRLAKAAKWDGVAKGLSGKPGGASVNVVAKVREATAETGIYLWQPAIRQQAEVAKDMLVLRQSAGSLYELGWAGIEAKATRARFMFWWRLWRAESALKRSLESQGHEETGRDDPTLSQYNWWRCIDAPVERISGQAGMTPAKFRALDREPFWHLIGHIL